MNNHITKQEEKIYRLCHQDFGGMTTEEAAKKMDIGQRRAQQLLRSLKIKSPQLFPVLTKQQAKIEDLINSCGLTYEQIAKRLRIAVSTIESTVQALKKKGIYFESGREILQYKPEMDDGKIKRKF